jgi:mono/diheme cytochrome c family protein
MSMQAIWIGIVLAALTLVHPVSAQGQYLGKNDFEQFCSECHGATGKGDGSKAKALGRKSADLTRLSEKNGAVFPVVRVYNVIDGRVEAWIHGPRDMPAWGAIYTEKLKVRVPPEYPPEMRDRLVRERILTMIEYLLTLQAK